MQSLKERHLASEERDPAKNRVRLPWLLVGSGAVFVAFLGIFLDTDPGSPSSQGIGNVCILLAALTAAGSCAQAARSRPAQSRAWLFLTVAALVYAAGMAIWTYYGITLNHAYPFPSAADLGFIGYSVPAAIGLFLFSRTPAPLVARLRVVLDALVIAASVLFISWATVLGPVYEAENSDPLGKLTGLAYPIVDVIITSLVLALGMRSQPGDRLPWLCLGGGLLVLALTDSIYVRLVFEGVSGATGTPLAMGWVSAFLLIALAPLVPTGVRAGVDRREYVLILELLPYVPVVGAVVASAPHHLPGDPFLLINGCIVVGLVMLRQVLIVFENVTLTRELESKVAQRTAELEGLASIVNSSADAIIGTTAEGVITSWNPGAERVYGYPSHDVIGRNISFLIPDHLREIEESFISEVTEEAATRSYETERLHSDGISIVPVSLTMSPIRGEAGIHGIATIAQDITERRLADAELREAREAALESSRLKSEFLATMSHEIRTPMNGVIGLTGLLLETGLDEVQRQYAEGVKGAGEALLSLINDILDFSKLEAGKVHLDPAPFDPRLVVEEVAGLLAEAAQAKQLELIAYCHPDVPARLLGDSGRIRQILLNLASNAVKFTPSGEVSIRVTAKEQDASKAVLQFEVRDTGIGIAPDDHERLFESFSQADASTTRRYGGTGLGLAISRRLTEAMGGTIRVTSALGEGSTFSFQLAFPVLEPGPATAPPAEGLLTGLRVLVVDDNATNRLVLESQLTAWQMVPEAVSEAPAALERARQAAAAGRPYDIAVLDMCMPGMDGMELAREMSADDALRSVRIIMLTSTMHVERTELSAAGVREWLTKPVRNSEFYDRLMRLMAVSPPTRAVASSPPRSGKPDVPSKGRILVVEDNEVNQLVARSMVVKLGYEVDVVADGSQALSATAVGDYLALLMDCHMPVMDGFEATRAIRARGGRAAALPIIAMTAGAMSEDRELCLAAGMDDYLTKPVDMAELDAALSRWAADQLATQTSAIDPSRLDILRGLGPEDGMGLLPAAANAFRQDIQPSLDALRRALNNGGGTDLVHAAHKLKGSAANIGAVGAVAICSELEELGRSHQGGGPELLARLEAELALVEKALDRALSLTP
jgi:PAS domain S-box-containing protein